MKSTSSGVLLDDAELVVPEPSKVAYWLDSSEGFMKCPRLFSILSPRYTFGRDVREDGSSAIFPQRVAILAL